MRYIVAFIASSSIYPSYPSTPIPRTGGLTSIFSTKNGVSKSFSPETMHRSWSMRFDSDQEANTKDGIS